MRAIYRIVYSSLHSYNKRLYTCLSMILRIGIWLPEFIRNDHFQTINENSYHTTLHPCNHLFRKMLNPDKAKKGNMSP